MKKKLLSILLCLCMVVTLLPTVALAAGWPSEAGIRFNYGIGSSDYIDVTMPTTDGYYTYGTCTTESETTTATQKESNAAALPASGWNWAVQYHTTLVNGANYTLTLKDFNLNYTGADDGLMFKTRLNLILEGTNIINAPNGGTALSSYFIDKSLYISGQGNLTVTGKTYGILGLCTISGGTVTATGGDAGIASTGADGITISGGTVTAEATGNNGAAFNKAPTLTSYTNYQWNTNESIPAWTASTTATFTNEGSPAYVQIQPFVMSVDFDGEGENAPTLYADFAIGWNAAVSDKNTANTTVKLLDNWTATGNGTNNSFGTGNGFGGGEATDRGYIRVPFDKTITLDLNGYDIDRALTSPVGVEDGNNADKATAGWVIGDFGTLTIEDNSTDDVDDQGKITGGYNSYDLYSVGGIYVNQSNRLTITGGNITGNKAINWGGGVYADGSSTVTMTGGKISGNIANYDMDNKGGAGGVFAAGSFLMTGGEISGNYACGSTPGGGVCLHAIGSMTVGGTAIVRDNKAGSTFDATSGTATGGTTDNVYLPTVPGGSSGTIACSTTKTLETDAYIGVTTETEPSAGSPVAITGNNSNNYSTYFHSDAGFATQNIGTDSAQVVKLALRSTTPTATTTTVAKTAATQASVAFTLTNDPALTGMWKVYADNSTTTVHSTVTAAIFGSTLTLTDSGSDIAAGTYYVSVTESGNAESDRLALTVGAYAGNAMDYTMDFMETNAVSWGAFNNHNFSTTDANGDGWSWDASEKTLTLSGLNFTTTARDAMYLPDDAKIVLQAGTTNTVESVVLGANNADGSAGIHAAGKLEISGSGTLNVAGGGVASEEDTGSKSSIGIYGGNNITLSGAVTVNATGGVVSGNSNNSSYGVCSNNGTVSVTGSATVTAKGGTVTASGDEYAMSCGVLADGGSFEVKGGTVTATGGTATAGNGSGESYGICSSGTTTISSGTVTATGGTASSNSLTAADSNTSYSYGIFSGNTIISGGTVTAETTSTITAGQKSAFMDLPKLTGYASYQWRTASSGAYTPSTTTKYTDNANHSYVEIKPYTAPSSPSTGGSSAPTVVTEIKQGGSTTGSNLDQLISGKKDLTVTDTNGAKLVFDTTALKGIDAKTTGSVTVKIEDVSKAHQTTHEGKTVFSLTVTSGGKTISDFGGSVTVSLPYTLKDGEKAEDVTVWYLASDGSMTEIPCTYDAKTGLATFTVTHFSEYVVGVDAEWVNPFSDVKESDWFYDDAAFVAAKGLMSGTSATTFAPYENTSRGMIVTILYRLEGQPAVTGANPFDDVQSGKYYESAIIWAAQNGIVSGYGNGKFGPDDDITREQMAAILYNYAKYKGYDVTASADLSKFTDSGKLSGYAASAMSWANANGLVTGKGNGILDPQGNAERCQVAAILHRFCENVVK